MVGAQNLCIRLPGCRVASEHQFQRAFDHSVTINKNSLENEDLVCTYGSTVCICSAHHAWRRSQICFASWGTTFDGWFGEIKLNWLLVIDLVHFLVIYSKALQPWRQSYVSKVTWGLVCTWSRCLEASGPFRSPFISKSASCNSFESWNRLESLRDVSGMLMVSRAWELGSFHHIGWDLDLLCKSGRSRVFIIGNRVTSPLIKWTHIVVLSRRWVVPLESHRGVVIEINLVTERKANAGWPERYILSVMVGSRIRRIRVRRLRCVHDSLLEILAARPKAMSPLALLEPREVRITGYGLIWIEEGWNLVGIRRRSLYIS